MVSIEDSRSPPLKKVEEKNIFFNYIMVPLSVEVTQNSPNHCLDQTIVSLNYLEQHCQVALPPMMAV